MTIFNLIAFLVALFIGILNGYKLGYKVGMQRMADDLKDYFKRGEPP